jgi:hypothetical protein
LQREPAIRIGIPRVSQGNFGQCIQWNTQSFRYNFPESLAIRSVELEYSWFLSWDLLPFRRVDPDGEVAIGGFYSGRGRGGSMVTGRRLRRGRGNTR